MNPRSRKLAPTLGLALVFAVSGAPTAIGSGDNGSGLDPWAYAAIHDSKTAQPMSQNANDL
jgi:hypothetical protein